MNRNGEISREEVSQLMQYLLIEEDNGMIFAFIFKKGQSPV